VTSQSAKEDSGDALKVHLAITSISLTIVLCVPKTRTCEVGSVSNRSLAFAWCVRINRCNRRSLCNVQRSGFCEAACTRGNLEQCVVSLVCFCGNQLHKKLGLRWICCGWFLGWSFPVDDTAWQVTEGRRSTSPGTIVEAGQRLDRPRAFWFSTQASPASTLLPPLRIPTRVCGSFRVSHARLCVLRVAYFSAETVHLLGGPGKSRGLAVREVVAAPPGSVRAEGGPLRNPGTK